MIELSPKINPSEVTVLIVDDIPLNVLLIEKMLKRYNFNIRKANGGQQALEDINVQKPTIILLDIMMPGITGYEVLKTIRQTTTKEELPIIMLSALSTNDDISKAMSYGANDFLSKPVVMERLHQCVVSHLNAVLG